MWIARARRASSARATSSPRARSAWAFLVTVACLFVDDARLAQDLLRRVRVPDPDRRRRGRCSSAGARLPGAGGVRPAYVGRSSSSAPSSRPTVVPLLPPASYLRYTRAIGFGQPRLENRTTNAMPQMFADRFGWPEMVDAVARAYHALPPDLRARTGIYANDFGQARRDRLLRPGARPAEGDQRPPHVLVLGPSRLFGREPHRPRRPARRARARVRGRARGRGGRPPVRDAPGALHGLPLSAASRLDAAVRVAPARTGARDAARAGDGPAARGTRGR